jgi:threonine dehydratase
MDEPTEQDLPTYADVIAASQTIAHVAHHTPIVTSRILDGQLGVRTFIKCENLQRMGAFKIRGAYNAISHYLASDGDRLNGVLTYSSGNHAQAIALSGGLLNVPSTIIMPKDAPPLKLEATKSYGGNVVFYDRYTEQRDEVAMRVKETLPEGTVFIPPYDHKYVMAGQGTVGKEIFEALKCWRGTYNDAAEEESIELDYLFVCVGGGGLIAGISLAAAAISPNTKIIGVEPEAGNDAQQSLEQGKIVTIETPRTIADGAQTQHLGKLVFPIMQRHVKKIVTVTDEELVHDMKFFGETMKMVVEPTGCLGLAGLRKMVENGEVPKGSCCGVVISGGNVDLERYCKLISSSY